MDLLALGMAVVWAWSKPGRRWKTYSDTEVMPDSSLQVRYIKNLH